MIQQEIKKRVGLSTLNIDNNFELWLDCYRGEYPWLVGDNLESLNLAAGISSELARLVTIELESEVDNEEVNEPYQKILEESRRFVEYGLALGGLIVKPYKVDEAIEVDFLTPNNFVILGHAFGEITHIIFIDRIKRLERDRAVYYTRLEEHDRRRGYTIANTAYKSNSPSILGDQIDLKLIDVWAGIAEVEEVDSEVPLFAYFKNPQANNLDLKAFEGVSCFSRALSLIQDADEQYQRVLWEYSGSELAIDADVTVLKETRELPARKERLFRNLGLDQRDGFYEVFSPEIRDSSLFNGLNKILRRIEFAVGLAYGTISEVDEVEKSATEIKASKQRSYSTVVDIQKELERTLREVVEILKYWLGVKDEVGVSFDFDDSLIVDTETEQSIRLQEVAAGIVKPEKYLEWRYGVEEKAARELMPGIEIDEEDDDLKIMNDTQMEQDSKKEFNGSQIASLIRVIESMFKKTITYDTAVKIIMDAFHYSEEKAKDLLGEPPTEEEIKEVQDEGIKDLS